MEEQIAAGKSKGRRLFRCGVDGENEVKFDQGARGEEKRNRTEYWDQEVRTAQEGETGVPEEARLQE